MQTAFFMKHFLSVLTLFVLLSNPVSAQKALDSNAVSKLYNTSWVLASKYKISPGIFHRHKRVETTGTERITFYQNEIHIEINRETYQICVHHLKNGNEFWLDCEEPNQLIYRIVSMEGNELIIDVLAKPFGETEYHRTTRKIFKRSTT